MHGPSPDDIKAWRKRLVWTQRDAAEALGVGRSTFEQWEQGMRNPPFYLWFAIGFLEMCEIGSFPMLPSARSPAPAVAQAES